MQDIVVKTLGWLYMKVPKRFRPPLKKFVFGVLIRLQSVVLRRRVRNGKRMEFLDFEIAHLEDFEFLDPTRHQVLVEVHNTVVSPGTEAAVLRGLPGARRYFPYTPGYSAAGRVVKTGKRVEGLQEGDYVAGRIPHCSRASVNAEMLFKIPEGVSTAHASFIELGIIVLQGIRKARIRPGDSVAILGQGLIGQLANRFARVVGGTPIVALAPSHKRETTALLPGGADKYIAFGEDKTAVENVRADVVIEAVGSPDAVTTAMRCARAGGRVVLLGSARGLGQNVDVFSLAQSRNLEIVGAHIGAMPEQDCSPSRWTYKQEGYLFLELLQRRRLSVESLVTWYAAPYECNAVYEVLAKGGGPHVGILFDWRANQ